MKRILFITFEYPTGRTYCGGVGQIVKQNRLALRDLGYEVYVLISSRFNKKSPVKLLLPDDSLIGYPNFWNFQKRYNWHEFDYIIQHFVNWAKELKKVKCLKGPRPKIIYHFHSILRREKDSGFKTLNHFLLNQERMIELADKIVCPSRYEYDNFIRYFPYFSEKVILIENTIEGFPIQKEEIKNLRKSHDIKKSDVVSIYVGRIQRIKGAHILIQDIPKLLKKYKRLKIFVIGKTLEKTLYRKLMRIQNRFPHQLIYIKYVEKKILYQYYYLSDIYINTSLSESFSLSTHESALCNNALLLNSLPTFDKFKDAALFFSSHESNGKSFTSQYEYLIKNKNLRSKISKKSSRIARDFLAKDTLRNDMSSLFKAF